MINNYYYNYDIGDEFKLQDLFYYFMCILILLKRLT